MVLPLPGDTVAPTRARSSAGPWVLSVAILSAALAVPLLATALAPVYVELGLLTMAAAASAWLLASTLRRRGRMRSAADDTPPLTALGHLLLHLWPVMLLTAVFPFATARMAGAEVDGVRLTDLLLAVSLTVPWLSQGVCLTLYRVVGPAVGDAVEVRQRFCAAWASSFVLSLPAVAVFALAVQVATGWSGTVMLAYLASCALHVAFAQSLVLVNLERRRWMWAAVWTGYALPLVVVPEAWFLPPLVGLLPQVVALGRHLLVAPERPDLRAAFGDTVRGLLLGSALWADKLLFLFAAGAAFPVDAVFLALLPAVLAYNYYFVRLAPSFDASVSRLRTAMESGGFEELRHRSTTLSEDVRRSLERTALAGALLVLGGSWALVGLRPLDGLLIVSVGVASWIFAMITVVAYKLDYIGHRRAAQQWSALHLLACVVAFAVLPAGPAVYLGLIAVDALVLLALLVVCVRTWRTPEYAFFWRHATAW